LQIASLGLLFVFVEMGTLMKTIIKNNITPSATSDRRSPLGSNIENAYKAQSHVTGVDNTGMTVEDAVITVLGVGNILLSDEGFGVHIVNELYAAYNFEPEINLLDGGTMGMELLGFMHGTTKLLLVDAINGGEEPGTVYQFNHDEVEQYFTQHISVHEVGMQDILRIHAMQEKPLEDTVVIGVEPKHIEIGLELTPMIESVKDEVKQRIFNQLALWGVKVIPK